MLDEIFKETNSDIQKSENVASSIIQPQQQSLQTFNSQNQHQLPINSEKLNSAASSVINPNIKPPPSGSSFPTEFNGQQQQKMLLEFFKILTEEDLINIIIIIFLQELLLPILLTKQDKLFILVLNKLLVCWELILVNINLMKYLCSVKALVSLEKENKKFICLSLNFFN
ncbi:hypothetical protein Mgra_00000433 [Meloidogyne graminicola]|uniref:Uncharacterized protein n=1 Tax=Meloidogyne graminicola TaxID=189291 RepID=A0A8T0A356_9BILA|nr:hypothetical protein Mgra_00000433 [Meloidogyne graminicola]